jgi:hypothetical protein
MRETIIRSKEMATLLKRREIIMIWSKQPEEMLDSYCCPSCRDILHEKDGLYTCRNEFCNFSPYKKEPFPEISVIFEKKKQQELCDICYWKVEGLCCGISRGACFEWKEKKDGK